ncbi:MAG TPA: hypothetical protein VNH83_28345 [Bryobacteraceae bacterium]|nr:hypothetical protein [Bryobacteraceae bacterium]
MALNQLLHYVGLKFTLHQESGDDANFWSIAVIGLAAYAYWKLS